MDTLLGVRTPRVVLVALVCAALAACRPAGVRTGTPGSGAGTDALMPLAPALHAARLPDAIADSTFWRMATEFSEPGGFFLSENFVSNELGLQEVISRLTPVLPPGGVYVGVGPEQNFTYLAALRPRVAFIVDIRRQNFLQHLRYKAIFELSPDRRTFLSRLFARSVPTTALAAGETMLTADSLIALVEAAPRDSILFMRTSREQRALLVQRHRFALDSSDLSTLQYLDSVFYLSGPSLNYSSGMGDYGSNRFRRMPTFAMIAGTTDEQGRNLGFLGSDSAYRVVRDMQRRNLVIPVVGNFAGSHALRHVGEWLRERDARVGAFYVSNVEQYLFRQNDDWSRFYANVGTMPYDENSRFIRSTTGGVRLYNGGGSNGGTMMMTQLISPVGPLVDAARTRELLGYQDVIARSR